MKKFFNDHVGLCFTIAVAVAGTALYFALKANSDNQKQAEVLDTLIGYHKTEEPK